MSNIVIVDDSNYIRQIESAFLEERGHTVVAQGEDGREGLELYKQYRPDLILVDITMPNKCGKDCLQEIISFDPQAKVIMVTCLSDEGNIAGCLELGASSIIHKPLIFNNAEYCTMFSAVIDNLSPQ